jgi:hypothetical protein
MKEWQQLNIIVLGSVALIALAAFGRAYRSVDEYVEEITQPAGQALSDLFAKFNGWEPVTLQPLLIRDFYLTSDYRLTPDAQKTLWKIDEYKPLLVELFGSPEGQLKPQYHKLINVEITKGNASYVF